jgi:hypothetical protein
VSYAERKAVDNHRATRGNWCGRYRRDPHYSDDLTADHITPLSKGGDPYGPLLAKPCQYRRTASK